MVNKNKLFLVANGNKLEIEKDPFRFGTVRILPRYKLTEYFDQK